MKGNRMTRLLLVARGTEKLKRGNKNEESGRLPGGHAVFIDLDCGVRYGIIGEPVPAEEAGGADQAQVPEEARKSSGGEPARPLPGVPRQGAGGPEADRGAERKAGATPPGTASGRHAVLPEDRWPEAGGARERTQSLPPEGAGETGSGPEGNLEGRPAQAPAPTGAATGGAVRPAAWGRGDRERPEDHGRATEAIHGGESRTCRRRSHP